MKYLKLQKNQARRTSEQIIRDAIYNGTSVVYAGGVATQAEAVFRRVTGQDLNLIQNKLTQQGGETITKQITGSTKVASEPIKAGYIGIVHHSMVYDLESIPGFVKAINYSSRTPMKGEIGSYNKIVFIEDTEGVTALDGKILKGVVFAEDAYATLTLKGSRNLDVIIRDKKLAGGALEEFSTIGWKFFQGAGIINENWIVRIETGTSFAQEEQAYFAK